MQVSDPAKTVPVVAVQGLIKQFPGVRALAGVDLQLLAGEVHGVIGENGAGKSTLMKILSGVYTPSSGQILLRGRRMQFRSPADAQRQGIVMIHQELNLVDELSVADNIFLGRERTRLGLVSRRATRHQASRLLSSTGCPIDPSVPVKHLSVAQKQMVEIAKALSYNASVLIMDEPTAVLTQREVETLFALIDRLKRNGVTVVYISHILPEVLRVCDRITVMRDGQIVTTLDGPRVRRATEKELASLMVGRPMGEHFPQRTAPSSQIELEVQNLSVPGLVDNASFALRQGEILGFAGLIGAGRTELAEAIAGLRKASSGSIILAGQERKIRSPQDAANAGIAYLSEDRKGRGLVLGMGIGENTTLVSLKRYCRPFLRRRKEEQAVGRHVRQLRIKVGQMRDLIDTLSGGNQQKVALAKWLETSPKVLIADEPTRGVDIGAKEEIYHLIQTLTQQGMACIFISSELNEVLGMCHRIAVMRAGQIVAIVDGATATEETIMHHAAGVEGAAVA